MRSKLLIAASLAFVTFAVQTAASRCAFAQQNNGAQKNDLALQQPSEKEQSLFNEGQSLYEKGKYEQASKKWDELLRKYPNSSIADLTLLWLGRAAIRLGKLQEAEQIGLCLHAFKETPFAAMYDEELNAARRTKDGTAKAKQASSVKPEVVKSQSVKPPATVAAKESAAAKQTRARSIDKQAGAQTVKAESKPSASSKPQVIVKSDVSKTNLSAVTTPKKIDSQSATNQKRAEPPAIRRSETPNVISPSESRVSALTEIALGKKDSIAPGEIFSQTIKLHNAGGAALSGARVEFVFARDFEVVGANESPREYNRATGAAVWDLGDLRARSSRTIHVWLRLRADVHAATQTTGSGALRAKNLASPIMFQGATLKVASVTRVIVAAAQSERAVAPGKTVYLPFAVENLSDHAESFDLSVVAPGAPVARLFADPNGDAQHQSGEKETATAANAPPGARQMFLLRVEIPGAAADGARYEYHVFARSVTQPRVVGERTLTLIVSRRADGRAKDD